MKSILVPILESISMIPMHDERRRIRHMKRRMRNLPLSESRLPRSMFRTHGGLRFYILWILSRSPLNGAGIMDRIEDETGGAWRPSPGSVYPLLRDMASAGLVERNENAVYTLTEKGRSEIDSIFTPNTSGKDGVRDEADRAVSQIESLVDYLEDIPEEVLPSGGRIREIVMRMSRLAERAER